MGVLIKNEFYKLKREWFMVFLLLLSLLPIITGGAGAIFNSSTTSLADLFFFMNNQFSMFFPMVLFILIGSLFYPLTMRCLYRPPLADVLALYFALLFCFWLD